MFAEHIEKLSFKKRMRFREMLDEIGELTLNTAWKKVRSLIKDDPRYDKFSSSDRVKSDLLFLKNVLFYFLIFFYQQLEMRKRVYRVHEGQNGSSQSRFPRIAEGNCLSSNNVSLCRNDFNLFTQFICRRTNLSLTSQ